MAYSSFQRSVQSVAFVGPHVNAGGDRGNVVGRRKIA